MVLIRTALLFALLLITLRYAASGNHEDVVQLLFAAGIDASKKDCSGMTASDCNSSIEIKRDERGNLSYRFPSTGQ